MVTNCGAEMPKFLISVCSIISDRDEEGKRGNVAEQYEFQKKWSIII